MALLPRICCAVLLILSGVVPAGAISHAPFSAAGVSPVHASPAAQEARVSLDQAVARVLSRYGGKVISAETRSRNGRVVHRIKLLSEDGRVRTVQVDGQTGDIS